MRNPDDVTGSWTLTKWEKDNALKSKQATADVIHVSSCELLFWMRRHLSAGRRCLINRQWAATKENILENAQSTKERQICFIFSNVDKYEMLPGNQSETFPLVCFTSTYQSHISFCNQI